MKLQSIFGTGNIDKEKEIAFWCNFFDKAVLGVCKEEEYLDLLEKLVRGKSMRQAN